MTSDTIISEIISGNFDDDLTLLKSAITERKSLITAQKNAALKLSLKPGDRIRFTDNARPKYLAGRGATVEKINPKKLVVLVDEGEWYEKGAHLGRSIITPLSLVEAL